MHYGNFLDKTQGIGMTCSFRLPRWHQDSVLSFYTFRLADSLPEEVTEKLKRLKETFLNCHPRPWSSKEELEFKKLVGPRVNAVLDNGHGHCLLRAGGCRRIVEDALLFYDGVKYDVDSFVIMPNHIHILVLTFDSAPVTDAIGRIKSYTATRINALSGRKGELWYPYGWDTLIRDEKHLVNVRNYIARNPRGLPKADYSLYLAGRWVNRTQVGQGCPTS